jgi:flagellar biosynthesis/type III secretory pathway protein FliH
MIQLPAALEAAFRQDLYTFEESREMPYITTVERAGIEKGLQQGMQQGEQIGYRKGEADLLLWLIEKKFGPTAVAGVQARIEGADSDTLRLWSERILTSDSLEAIFR